jgi:hypothetical protein
MAEIENYVADDFRFVLYDKPNPDARSGATGGSLETIPLASGDPWANRGCFLVKYTGFPAPSPTASRRNFPSTLSILEMILSSKSRLRAFAQRRASARGSFASHASAR